MVALMGGTVSRLQCSISLWALAGGLPAVLLALFVTGERMPVPGF
jgi:hypothetical protein